MVVDNDYTDKINRLTCLGEDFHHCVFTVDEVDAMIFGGYEEGAADTIALAEAGIERSTGLKVDLSPQGPARDVVVRAGASKNQEHNTFVARMDSQNQRDVSAIDRDRATLPKVTPQDANVMARSLDFPPTRPRGTALDGFRLDDKDNPVEAAFINQITVAQVLNHWGVPVDDLLDCIDQEWGIDYSRRLIQDLSFAKAADLESYIASGGRPPPGLYMSPNLSAMASIVQSPTVQVTDVGYTSAFMGRAKVMTKFLLLNVNIFRGQGSLRVLFTHSNPALMSTFHPSMLEDWTIGADAVSGVQRTKLRGSIPGITDYDTFVSKRQAAAVAARNYAVKVHRIEAAIARVSMESITMGTRRVIGTFSDRIMAGREVEQVVLEKPKRDSDPKRAGPILFDVFNGDPYSALYSNVVSASGMVAMLCAAPKDRVPMAKVIGSVRSSKGIGECFQTLNIESLRRNEFYARVLLAARDTDTRTIVSLALLTRHLDHVRPTIMNALASAWEECCVSKDWSNPWRKIETAILDMGSPNPFKHLARYRAAATGAGAASSMLVVNEKLLRWVQGDEQVRYSNPKPLGSEVRYYWSMMYRDMCKVWQNIAYTGRLAGFAGGHPRYAPTEDDVKTSGFERCAGKFMVYAAYCEMVRCQALKIAYRWVRVRVGAPFETLLAATTEGTAAAFEMDRYLRYIRDADSEGFEPDIYLEYTGQLASNEAASHPEVVEGARFIMTAVFDKLDTAVAEGYMSTTARDIVRELGGAVSSVRATTREAVMRDKQMIDSMVQREPDPPDEESVISSGSEEWETQEVVERLDEDIAMFNIADMVAKALPTPVEQKAVDLCASVLDRLCAAADDIYVVDEAVASALEEFCQALDDTLYQSMSDKLDALAEKVREFAGGDEDLVAYALDHGLREEILSIAATVGVEDGERPIMH